MKNAKTVAELLEAGTIAADGSGECKTCSSYPEVLDGYRSAAPGKFTFNGSSYCGTHVRTEANGNEYEWNSTKCVYVKRTEKKEKAPVQLIGGHKPGTKAAEKYLANLRKPCDIQWVPGQGVKACYQHNCMNLTEADRCEKAL